MISELFVWLNIAIGKEGKSGKQFFAVDDSHMHIQIGFTAMIRESRYISESLSVNKQTLTTKFFVNIEKISRIAIFGFK
jgi:hypothetical protein